MKAELVENYNDLILECFKTDPELLEKWHICAPDSLEKCVDNTITVMQLNKVSVYSLTINNNIIGYFGLEYFNNQKYLTGFFIKPEYRNKEMFELFWNVINKKFGKNYYAGVYKKNERAVNFLLKSGGIKAWENTESGSVFIMMNWGK